MSSKNVNFLSDENYSDIYKGEKDGFLTSLEDTDLSSHWHEGQPTDLSKGMDLKKTQRFFDAISRKAFLPWLRALTGRLNAHCTEIKKIKEEDIPAVEKRLETVEQDTVEGLEDRLKAIEEDTVTGLEDRLESIEKKLPYVDGDFAELLEDTLEGSISAAEEALRAAETAQKKDRADRLVEQNKKIDFTFWVGTEAEYEEQKDGMEEHMFCLTTDDGLEEQVLADIEALKTGKAPAGFGLGGPAKVVNDPDKATASGFYALGGASCVNNPGTYYFAYGTLLVENRYDALIKQTFSGANGITAMRYRDADTREWSELEYVNPPMYEGVEYRTIEKYMGKPVYTKLINCGLSENGMSVKFSGIEYVLRYTGTVSRFTIPHLWTTWEGPWSASVSVSNTEATMFFGSSLEGKQTYLQIWYTKS